MSAKIGIIIAAPLAFLAVPAHAQSAAQVITACGTPPSTLKPGQVRTEFMDVNGNLCSSATLSGTITVGTVGQGAKGTDAAADSWYVQPGTGASFPVTGTFFQATQPVSAASLPLPAGASTSALQTTGNTALTTINTTLGSPFQVGGSIGNTSFAATQGTSPWVVSGTVTATTAVITGTFTNRSGSIAAGGTSQTLAASNGSRKRILVQNPCSAASQNIGTAENLFINFTSAASTTNGQSIELVPCGSYDSGAGPVSTEAVTVNGATTAHQFAAKEE